MSDNLINQLSIFKLQMQQLFSLKFAKVKVDGLSALVEGKLKLFTQITEGKDIKTIAGLD